MYYNKLALFGLAIEVFFESCNPLLHTLGCMRLARRSGGAAYLALSRLFVAQFFLFRHVACGKGCLLVMEGSAAGLHAALD